MRLLFLTLLLISCVGAGFFGDLATNVKNVFTGEQSLGAKLKNATVNAFRKLKIGERFKGMGSKILKTLKLTPQMMKSLKERLSKLRPIKHDHIKKEGDSINEINAKVNATEHLFQSDIALTKQQADMIAKEIEEEAAGVPRAKRQAFKDKNYPRTLWSAGVNYFFDKSASKQVQSVFLKGAKAWEKDTCINFRENANAEDAIRVFKEEGCWSFVGRLGGKQDLSLGEGCESIGTAAHELGHALGFFHTMSRHDRNDYITVATQNVKPDWLDQFTLETTSTNDNYGMPYDYGSIMHYGGTSASANKKPTMVPFDTNYQETLGSPFISFIDLSMLNHHYGCKSKCDPKKSAQCSVGGFPHPRDCSRCVCPGGYGGKRCTERPAGCGKILQASAEFETLKDVVGKGGDVVEDFEMCNYWIQVRDYDFHIQVP
ncbi:hypothetical protein Y032_0844g2648 [Ancylostoma ceylanicum]|uniref:Zinc metalloproteinase n=1 Tax=Ancylostoma ceylanicum TaxID=53326 RepID=A0A016WAN8_9BILA|nr:hypothetical protein Y032_0844g2648 [Ancylostoma ceylanicum]